MLRKKIKESVSVNAPDEFCFWVSDGRVLCNLHDLRQALKEMSNETFRYHVNKEKNDFAKWVEEVLHEGKLAKQIKRTKTREAILKKVEARLK